VGRGLSRASPEHLEVPCLTIGARLTVHGRLLVVQRHQDRWTQAHIAAAMCGELSRKAASGGDAAHSAPERCRLHRGIRKFAHGRRQPPSADAVTSGPRLDCMERMTVRAKTALPPAPMTAPRPRGALFSMTMIPT